MNRLSFETIEESSLLAKQLIDLADRALIECDDYSCLLLSSIIRDSAYTIKQAVAMYLNSLEVESRGDSDRESLSG